MRVVELELLGCEARLFGHRNLLVGLFFHRRKSCADFLFPDCESDPDCSHESGHDSEDEHYNQSTASNREGESM